MNLPVFLMGSSRTNGSGRLYPVDGAGPPEWAGIVNTME